MALKYSSKSSTLQPHQVVIFSDESIAVVPACWVNERNNTCLFFFGIKEKQLQDILNDVLNEIDLSLEFTKYDVIIFGSYGT